MCVIGQFCHLLFKNLWLPEDKVAEVIMGANWGQHKIQGSHSDLLTHVTVIW
jgi:hypothetical protein